MGTVPDPHVRMLQPLSPSVQAGLVEVHGGHVAEDDGASLDDKEPRGRQAMALHMCRDIEDRLGSMMHGGDQHGG